VYNVTALVTSAQHRWHPRASSRCAVAALVVAGALFAFVLGAVPST
jgi:hypothetical protein